MISKIERYSSKAETLNESFRSNIAEYDKLMQALKSKSGNAARIGIKEDISDHICKAGQ